MNQRSRSQYVPRSNDDTASVQRSTGKRLSLRAEVLADIPDGHCVDSLHPKKGPIEGDCGSVPKDIRKARASSDGYHDL